MDGIRNNQNQKGVGSKGQGYTQMLGMGTRCSGPTEARFPVHDAQGFLTRPLAATRKTEGEIREKERMP